MHPFVTRLCTSIVLGTVLWCAFFYLSPIQLSAFIACLYGYACIVEFIPLAIQSRHTALIATGGAGFALVTTAFLHILWLIQGLYLYLYICIGSAVLNDIGGYIAGNLFGKHLLAPTVSPKKTWEGLAGSIFLTSGVFFIVTKIFLGINPYLVALCGALLSLAALAGDLLISYLKRAAGVKNTGNILPGHGGILDRLDSIIGTTIAFALVSKITLTILFNA